MAYKSIIRAAARLLLPDLIANFGSATAVLRELKSQGMGYRRQVFLDDFRMFDSRLNLTDAREAWDTSTPFETDLIPELFLPEGKRYRVYGWVTYYDPAHDALIRKRITHYSDYSGSEGFYQDEITSLIEGQEQYSDDERWIVANFEVLGVEHNRRMEQQVIG